MEAYWRTRLIDKVTVDDDKVAPVYCLDEISDTIRSSPGETVRDLVEYTMRRLNHKSPRVKQKALRMVKYVVPKAGPEFRRQMQRQSATIRQLFDYKGQADSLRGDALNKAVRDTAHEAIAAIFSTDEKISQTEDVNKRIMGFGNTNFDMPPQGKKSLINDVVNEVVEFGSSSIRQSLNKISGYTSSGNGGIRSNDSGSYRGPSLRKSLTSERESFDRYERTEPGDLRFVSEASNARTRPSAYDSRISQQEVSNEKAAENGRGASQEEMLLDTITAPGGMRLQPTRENLQIFLATALKLDPKNLAYSLESKLRSHAWQVRLKALCVLEAITHQEDTDFYGIIVEMFEKDADALFECLQCPQTSVREKAKKVLDSLNILRKDSCAEEAEGPTDPNSAPPTVVHDMPDLIDTSEPDLLGDASSFPQMSVSTAVGDVSSTSNSAITGGAAFSGDGLLSGAAGSASGTESDDLFAGVSVHASDNAAGELTGDLFSGLLMGDNNKPSGDGVVDLLLNNQGTGVSQTTHPGNLADLMGNISLSNSGDSVSLNGACEHGATVPKSLSTQAPHYGNAIPPQILGNLAGPQLMYMNPSLMLPTGVMGGFQAPMMMSPNFGAGAQGNTYFQQQLLSGMTGLQRFGMGASLANGGNVQTNTGSGRVLSASFAEGFDFSGDATSRYSAAADFTKKEDTKAFDFISDHVCAARGPKKIP